LLNENLACPYCDFSLDDLEPRMFSFNSPYGACPDCKGLGFKQKVDEDLIVPDKKLSINQGAIIAIK
jgi:excinuclease ABC subunit A